MLYILVQQKKTLYCKNIRRNIKDKHTSYIIFLCKRNKPFHKSRYIQTYRFIARELTKFERLSIFSMCLYVFNVQTCHFLWEVHRVIPKKENDNLNFCYILLTETANSRDILIDVHFGDPVLLTCEGNGSHIWVFKNMTIMDEKSSPHDNGYSDVSGTTFGNAFSYLFVETFLPWNLGNYSCFVASKLVYRYIPRILERLRLVVPPGESIRLNCSDGDINSTQVYWRYNGKVVYSPFDPRQIGTNKIPGRILSESTSVLQIDEFTKQSEGYYTCFSTKGKLRAYELLIRVTDLNLYLRIKINGEDNDEMTYLLSQHEYNISCNFDRPVTAVNLITTINSTVLTTRGQQTILETNIFVSRDSTVLMTFPRNTLEVMISCMLRDVYYTEIQKNEIVLPVIVVPVLRLQIDEQNVSGIYQGRKDQPVLLKCVAFGARPKITMEMGIGTIHNETIPRIKETQNKNAASTFDYEMQQAIVLKEDITATCTIYGQQGFSNNSVNIKILVDGLDEEVIEGDWYDIIYRKGNYLIAISIGITFSVIVCAYICIKRRFRSNRQHVSNKYRFSRMSSLRGRQPLTIISLLHCGEIYSYWKSTIAGCANGDFIVAKTFTGSGKKTKGKITITEISKCLQNLSQHRNLVNYLGRSIGEATQYIYLEYVDGGTLLSYLKNCQPRINFTEINKILPTGLVHPDVFAKHITEALQYLHDNEFCHPVLSSSKVLLNGSRICKLFDFWPMEYTSYKITNLFSRELPSLRWLPPETKTSRQYDLASDIWSFGIILWEIYSFGQIPSDEIYQRTSRRKRQDDYEILKKPMYCSQHVFDLMKDTWHEKRENRPTISLVRSILNSEWNSFQERDNDDREAYYGRSERAPSVTYQSLILK